MTASRLTDAVGRLARHLGTDDRSGLPDGHLLTLFVEHRDAAAFEGLVRRHGPMVLGVCRRLLGDGPDADDAFQAAFLVLVRKAKSVRPRELVGHWLYGVARTTAVRAKSLRAKRQSREGPMVDAPDPRTADALADDRLALLDLELGRLPEKYRVPIVLCDLGGKSHKEAAAHLGWPVGTVSGRLSRGRQMLVDRLARRGLPVAGGLFASLTTAGVSESLTAAAVRFAAGGTIPARVLTLTEGVLQVMLVNKLKAVVPALMVLVACGTGGVGYRMQAADEPAKPAGAKEKPAEPKVDVMQTINRANKKDQEAMQGTWALADAWVKSSGEVHEFKDLAGKFHLRVWDDSLQLFAANAGRLEKSTGFDFPFGHYFACRFLLQTTAAPKRIDLKVPDHAGETLYGIYSLDGDRLTFCGQLPEDGRPRHFDRPKDGEADKLWISFRRTKETPELADQRRLARMRENIHHGVDTLVRDNRLQTDDESSADYLRHRLDTLDEINRITKAMRDKTERELNAQKWRGPEPRGGGR